jgi:hypothetical protein
MHLLMQEEYTYDTIVSRRLSNFLLDACWTLETTSGVEQFGVIELS